ncbi:hypothetical protein DKP78_19680, partial [Enterococcus faecium]
AVVPAVVDDDNLLEEGRRRAQRLHAQQRFVRGLGRIAAVGRCAAQRRSLLGGQAVGRAIVHQPQGEELVPVVRAVDRCTVQFRGHLNGG